MNWERGFKRAWYFVLGLIWLVTLFFAALQGPAQIGESVVGLLLFTLGWQLFGGALLWVARGFRRDDQKPPSAG